MVRALTRTRELKFESHFMFDETDLIIRKELLCASNLHDKLTGECRKLENQSTIFSKEFILSLVGFSWPAMTTS